MTVEVDEGRLDDVEALATLDSRDMLRAVATSAAQVRSSATAATEAGIDALAAAPRPRALVVAAMGGSAIAGDVLVAVAGSASPVPVIVHRGPVLPGWVGAADMLVAVSCSGRTRETLAATEEAVRRGVAVVGVGADDSPLAALCRGARAAYVPVQQQLTPRSSMWALATPLLVTGARLGLLDLGRDGAALEAAANRLELVAETCRVDRESFVNPAKTLALELAGSVPMVWGAGAVGPVAALRLACQLNENAKYPAVVGALPEAHHNQVVALDGPLAGASAEADLFRDRVDDEAPMRMRLVLVEDGVDPSVVDAVDASEQLAVERGVPVSRMRAEGAHPVERLASLLGVADYASVYLALAYGIDPTPVDLLDTLKRRQG
jgi:glucose/mannose-6-phosphate isomerase